MSMMDQFQKLDDLIIEHTQPPVRTMLRNQLALTREQIEAYQAASDKQDQALAAQAETIAALQQQKASILQEYAAFKKAQREADTSALQKEANDYRQTIQGKMLNHDL